MDETPIVHFSFFSEETQVEKNLWYLWKVNLLFADAETMALSFLKLILECYSVRYSPNAYGLWKTI